MGQLRKTTKTSGRTVDMKPGFEPGFLLHVRQKRHHLIQLDRWFIILGVPPSSYFCYPPNTGSGTRSFDSLIIKAYHYTRS
jgi:hypothetical protein